MRYLRHLFILFSLSFLSNFIQAQVGNVEFGKNRVQYTDDQETWYYHETDHFRTYWYGKSRNYGKATVMMAELDHDQVQDVLEHHLNQKISIIVFSDISDLQQSNIGTEEVFGTKEGETKIIGDKIFVYFDGNHQNLRKQVREGIASVYISSLILGQNLTESVQNAFLLNWPEWFSKGMVGYLGSPWNIGVDKRLKEAMSDPEINNFEDLSTAYPKLAGHAFWYFLGQNYGDATVSNILYMSRVNRSAKIGVLYVIGQPIAKVKKEIFNYFKSIYKVESKSIPPFKADKIKLKNRFKGKITLAKLSPDGRYVIYVSNEIGKIKGRLVDLTTNKTTRIFKFGERNPFQKPNYEYPQVAWKPNSLEFSLITERKDILRLENYLLADLDNPIILPVAPGIRHIFSMEYLDMETLVMSVDNKGASDLISYNINTRQSKQLTNDLWDDLDVKVTHLRGKKGILFASNRPDLNFETNRIDTFIPIDNFDIFYMGIDTNLNVKITDTRLTNERNPVAVDSQYYTYISYESGTPNLGAGYLEDYIDYYERTVQLVDGTKIIKNADSSIAQIDTSLIDSMWVLPIIKTRSVTYNNSNLPINLQAHSYSDSTKQTLFIDKTLKGEVLYLADSLKVDRAFEPRKTFYRNFLEKYPNFYNQSIKEKYDGDVKEQNEQGGGFYFQTEFESDELAPIDSNSLVSNIFSGPQHPVSANGLVKVIGSKTVPYQLKFKGYPLDFKVDNSLLFQGLNTFAGNPADQFQFPEVGLLLRSKFEDILEDYQINLGLRIPIDFRGLEYFIQAQDKKNQLDRIYSLYQKVENLNDEPNLQAPFRREKRNVITMLVSEFRYPLDIFRSIRGTATFRNDRIIQRATDGNQLVTSTNSPLTEPNNDTQRIGIKGEYVFDNSYEHYTNIRFGSRYKVFAEIVKSMSIDLNDGFNLNFNEGFMTVLGFDARHYVRIDKHSILALRGAGATTLGKEKILYSLGGVDGWINPSYDDTPQPAGNFAFRGLAAQMRGFKNNVRNGNSYLLTNVELRVPVVRYLFPRNIRSRFFRDLHFVGFFDAGVAWAGVNPFSPDNPVNTEVIAPSDKVVVNVTYFNDPLVFGYGVGVRTTVLGQFVKVDYAWGQETGNVQDPILYISLGVDF